MLSISSFYFIFICALSLLNQCTSLPPLINSFQTKTFSFLSNDTNSTNFVISPLSLYQALSLLSNGARGSTEYEIINSINHNNLVDQNIYNFKMLNTTRSSVVLANAVLSKFPPSDSFIQISNRFKAFISELTSVEQVNQWCYNKTNGTIPSIIDNIDNTVLIILNAVYFKNEWKHKFEFQMTYTSTFTNINNTTSNVNMMKQLNVFNYYEDSNVQVIELEYKYDNISAIIILPQNEININTYINNNFNETTLQMYCANMTKQEIEIHLPKFTIESHLNLNNVLKRVGIKRPFNNTAADFKLISPHGNLYISSIIQRAVIKVNEEGTEAAGVTAVVLDGLLMPKDHIKKVVVNRPFIFMIKDNVFTKNYAFIAKVVNL